MSIIDKANEYVGHPREVDEGYEVSMRRDAYIKGYEDAIKEFASLVKRMREKQWNADMITGEEDIEFIDMVHIEQREAEREVDEYLKKMEDLKK